MSRITTQQDEVYKISAWVSTEILNNFISGGKLLYIRGMNWDTLPQRKLQEHYNKIFMEHHPVRLLVCLGPVAKCLSMQHVCFKTNHKLY